MDDRAAVKNVPFVDPNARMVVARLLEIRLQMVGQELIKDRLILL